MDSIFLNIPLPQVVPDQQTSLINSINMNTSLVGDRIKTGFGSQSISADSQGWWIGSENPDTAPFYVDMSGNISIRASALTQSTAIRFYDTDGNEVIFIGMEDA